MIIHTLLLPSMALITVNSDISIPTVVTREYRGSIYATHCAEKYFHLTEFSHTRDTQWYSVFRQHVH